jgi:hypothetical protein
MDEGDIQGPHFMTTKLITLLITPGSLPVKVRMNEILNLFRFPIK